MRFTTLCEGLCQTLIVVESAHLENSTHLTDWQTVLSNKFLNFDSTCTSQKVCLVGVLFILTNLSLNMNISKFKVIIISQMNNTITEQLTSDNRNCLQNAISNNT